MTRIDYRAIWPLRGPVKRCQLCRKRPADLFMALKEAPTGEPRQFYMCGACLYNHLIAALDAKLSGTQLDALHTYLSVDGDPMDVVKEQQAEKERNWRN